MSKIIDIEKFIELSKNLPVIDVRSEGEFNQGHFTGSFSIPLFNNEERAEIGTLYKKQGKDLAFLRGLDLVGPKMSGLVKAALKVTPLKEVIVYCWRGGMRSNSFGWLLEKAGFKVYVVEKGYKNIRHYIRESFKEKAEIIVLSGTTGSGKTEILQEIAKLGEQMIDLEGLANHKGSAFGSLGQDDQPTNEQFENDLFYEWAKIDKTKKLWLEDESRKIGKMVLNESFFLQMRNCPVIRIEVPLEDRLKRLAKDYCEFPKEVLISSLSNIRKRLGGKDCDEGIKAIEDGNYQLAVAKVLEYYDKAYNFGLSKRDQKLINRVEINSSNVLEIAREVVRFSKEM